MTVPTHGHSSARSAPLKRVETNAATSPPGSGRRAKRLPCGVLGAEDAPVVTVEVPRDEVPAASAEDEVMRLRPTASLLALARSGRVVEAQRLAVAYRSRDLDDPHRSPVLRLGAGRVARGGAALLGRARVGVSDHRAARRVAMEPGVRHADRPVRRHLDPGRRGSHRVARLGTALGTVSPEPALRIR